MNRNGSTNDDYAFSRVPLHARFDLLSIVLIRVGGLAALSQFMLGATLGHAMTFSQAMLATLLGSLILEFVGLWMGMAGSREGLPTSLLARWCGFGRVGSIFIGIAIVISGLGWLCMQNSILAEGLVYATNGHLNFGWAAAISGMSLTVLVAFGFKALSWTAKITVPLFFAVIGWILFDLLRGHNIANLIAVAPTGTPLTLGAAATAIAGSYIVGAIITPDISRYCQNRRDVFWMMTITIIIGEFIVNGIAILVAHTLNTADVVTIMTQSAGLIGLLTIILSAVKVNDVILYSVSLAVTNVIEGITGKIWRYTWITLILGTISTVISTIDILDKFTDFLILLGVLFPPIAGVMLVDYYILLTSRELLDTSRAKGNLPTAESTPSIGWPAIISWIAGSLVGLTIEQGIPSLNSLLAASIIYWTICTVRKVHSTKMR
ncbi:purine-cytosine permease family protein [Candidatus Regiella insecticola]|uniref:Cytosine permease n=2 Tax=Candidatus Regiella insecticola TaxID=138073 RepID=A0A6L2ZKN9_9ENTR|nr:cytosine permease [Candidatus Regiella insecticola]GFN45407.1 cytosine permease [Candidatus Regiella insecticola]